MLEISPFSVWSTKASDGCVQSSQVPEESMEAKGDLQMNEYVDKRNCEYGVYITLNSQLDGLVSRRKQKDKDSVMAPCFRKALTKKVCMELKIHIHIIHSE